MSEEVLNQESEEVVVTMTKEGRVVIPQQIRRELTGGKKGMLLSVEVNRANRSIILRAGKFVVDNTPMTAPGKGTTA